MKIDTISNKGLVSVKFYDPVIVPAEFINFTDIIMNITIQNEDMPEDSLLLNSWTMVNFTSENMLIKLTFTDPLRISYSSVSSLFI